VSDSTNFKPGEFESDMIKMLYSTGIDLQKENQALKNRIKHLEEALDLVIPHCSFVHHSKKHQHAYDEPCPVVALIENAKEAKP
jgi:hypothetical protein